VIYSFQHQAGGDKGDLIRLEGAQASGMRLITTIVSLGSGARFPWGSPPPFRILLNPFPKRCQAVGHRLFGGD
jgi:hypothetical protein